jgi:hypothetical protein
VGLESRVGSVAVCDRLMLPRCFQDCRFSIQTSSQILRGEAILFTRRQKRPSQARLLLLSDRGAAAKVEAAGIEPASAIACKVTSTSVAGALISLSTRHAGGVIENQLQNSPQSG